MKALIGLLALLPLPALALSCLPYRVTDAYRDAAQSKAPYVVVRGTLRFDEGKLPDADMTGQTPTPERTVLSAEVEGVALGPLGQRIAKTYKTRLVVTCTGPWCARPRPGDVIAFLRKDGRKYVLETNPCGGFLFNRPQAKDIHALQNCLNSKPCEASNR